MPDVARVSCHCMICGTQEAAYVFTKEGFDLVKCKGCGLVYVANPPTLDKIEQQYSFEMGYHTQFADANADVSSHTAAASRHLAVLQRYKQSGRLLDIGCSAGFFLAGARDAGWMVSGVELSAGTAEIARRRFQLEVMTGTLNEDTFPAKSFDAVTMWDVIEHVPDPVSTLVTVSRILKDDGVILMETPNIDGLFPQMSYWAAKALDYWPHPEPPGHLFQFSKATVRRLLEAAGLQLLAIEDRRSPLDYTFGSVASLMRSPKRLAYALVFLPVLTLGPLLRLGDSIVIAAAKAEAA